MPVWLVLFEGVQDIHAEGVHVILILEEAPQIVATVDPIPAAGQDVIHFLFSSLLRQEPEAGPLEIPPAHIIFVTPAICMPFSSANWRR